MNPMHGIGFWHLSFDEMPRVRKEVEDVSAFIALERGEDFRHSS